MGKTKKSKVAKTEKVKVMSSDENGAELAEPGNQTQDKDGPGGENVSHETKPEPTEKSEGSPKEKEKKVEKPAEMPTVPGTLREMPVRSQLVAVFVCEDVHRTKGFKGDTVLCVHCAKPTKMEGYYENEKYVKAK